MLRLPEPCRCDRNLIAKLAKRKDWLLQCRNALIDAAIYILIGVSKARQQLPLRGS